MARVGTRCPDCQTIYAAADGHTCPYAMVCSRCGAHYTPSQGHLVCTGPLLPYIQLCLFTGKPLRPSWAPIARLEKSPVE